MNTKHSALALLFMLILGTHCSTPSTVAIQLSDLSSNSVSSTKLLDVRIRTLDCTGVSASYVLDVLFAALRKHGYQISYFHDNEEALKRDCRIVGDVKLRDCDVRTALTAILSSVRLGYTVESPGLVIDCAEYFYPSLKERKTWAGSISVKYIPPSHAKGQGAK